MGKPTICIGENKDADQLRGNREADQRLCFRYSDSTIPLLLISKISSFYPAYVLVQAGLCRTCSETTLLVFPRGGSCVWKLKLSKFNSSKDKVSSIQTSLIQTVTPRGKETERVVIVNGQQFDQRLTSKEVISLEATIGHTIEVYK